MKDVVENVKALCGTDAMEWEGSGRIKHSATRVRADKGPSLARIFNFAGTACACDVYVGAFACTRSVGLCERVGAPFAYA